MHYKKKINFLCEQLRLKHVTDTENMKHFIMFVTSEKLMISLITFLTSYARVCYFKS